MILYISRRYYETWTGKPELTRARRSKGEQWTTNFDLEFDLFATMKRRRKFEKLNDGRCPRCAWCGNLTKISNTLSDAHNNQDRIKIWTKLMAPLREVSMFGPPTPPWPEWAGSGSRPTTHHPPSPLAGSLSRGSGCCPGLRCQPKWHNHKQ